MKCFDIDFPQTKSQWVFSVIASQLTMIDREGRETWEVCVEFTHLHTLKFYQLVFLEHLICEKSYGKYFIK